MTNYRFSIIPAGAITDTRLKLRDLQVLALLGRHTNKQGWCRRKHRTIATELDCSRSTVQTSLDRLYATGYVQRKLEGIKGQPTPDEGHHPYRSHSYRVLLDTDDQRAQEIRHLAAQKIGHVVPEDGEKSSENADEIRLAPGADEFEDDDSADLFDENDDDVAPHDAKKGESSAPYEDSPSEPTPCEPLGEQASNNCSQVKCSDSEPLKTGNGSQPTSSAQFAEFMAKWPTAASDDQAKALRAWGKLSLDERSAALSGIQRFLAKLKADKRDHVPSSCKYLDEKRWTLIAASTGNTREFWTWSRDFWGLVLAALDGGKSAHYWLNYADQGGSPAKRVCIVKPELMPSIDQLALLTAFPSDGDEIAAWRPWFEAHGVRLPPWSEKFWVYLPSAVPPSGKKSVWG